MSNCVKNIFKLTFFIAIFGFWQRFRFFVLRIYSFWSFSIISFRRRTASRLIFLFDILRFFNSFRNRFLILWFTFFLICLILLLFAFDLFFFSNLFVMLLNSHSVIFLFPSAPFNNWFFFRFQAFTYLL